MGGSNTITEVCKELSSAGASHVDIFKEWVTDFADSAGKNAKLKDTWADANKMKADTGKCMDGWESKHDYSDADCRMTAFLWLDSGTHESLVEATNLDRKSTRLNSSHIEESRMPSSA